MNFSSAFQNVFGDVSAHESWVFTYKGLSPISSTRNERSGCGDCGDLGGKTKEHKALVGKVDVISVTKSFCKKP